jgi:hypothetical protein
LSSQSRYFLLFMMLSSNGIGYCLKRFQVNT